MITTEQNRVLLFEQKPLCLDEESFIQLTGADITEQFRLTAALKENNSKNALYHGFLI